METTFSHRSISTQRNFLWFIREVSATEVQQDFEQVFRSHILQNQAAGGDLVNPFNGDILIAHIESNYVTDNSDSITAMEHTEI